MRYLVSLGLALAVMGCSEAANINGLIAGDSNKGSVFHLLERAQHFYDKAEFDTALDYARVAYDTDPRNEDVGLMLGYVHMALAGIDSLQLIKNMMEQNSTPTPTPTPAPGLMLADGNAGSTLSGLSKILGMDDSERQELTLAGNRIGNVEGAPKTGPFKSLPVLLPKSATEARDGPTKTVHNIFLAIYYICPFVDDDVKIREGLGDPRHTSVYCDASDNTVKNSAKLHYLWAVAHLIEAIAFHGVVLYQPDGVTPNLIKRSDALGSSAGLDLNAYIKAVSDLATTVDVILPTRREQARDSMLNAMFNDFDAASRGFGKLAGIPDSVTGSITSSLAKLKEQQAKAGAKQEGAGVDSGSGAMKEQLTSGLSGNLKKQIEAKDKAGELTPAKKTELCSAYQSISSEAFATCSPAAAATPAP